MRLFPASGEINRTLSDPAAALRAVEDRYAGEGPAVDRTDGLSLEFARWRFNLRMSNTEPLLRLNVEAADAATMARVRDEVLAVVRTDA
jgi:phosphomannomutase